MIKQFQFGGPIATRILKGLIKPTLRIKPPMSFTQSASELLPNAEKIGKRALKDFYNSDNYMNRLRSAGMWRTPLKRPQVIDQLITNLDRTKLTSLKPTSLKNSNASNVKGIALGLTKPKQPRLSLNGDGSISKVIINPAEVLMNPSVVSTEQNFLRVLEHELLHASSNGSNGLGSTIKKIGFTNPITKMKQIATVDLKQSPIDKIMEYDKNLMKGNIVSKEDYLKRYKQLIPNKPKEHYEQAGNMYDYVTSPQEWRARGLQLQLDAAHQGKSLADYIMSNPKDNINYKQMVKYATPQQIYKYASKALGLAVPMGVGATYMLSNNQIDNFNNIS